MKTMGIRKRVAVLVCAVILTISGVTPSLGADTVFNGTSKGWRFLDDAYIARTAPITDAECQAIMDNLLALQAELAEADIYFMVFIAPDKEEIYSDILPKQYQLTWPDPLDYLVTYLHENAPDLPVIYPKQALLDARNDEKYEGANLYFSDDSHWNHIGASIGTRVLAQAVGEHFGRNDLVKEHTFFPQNENEVRSYHAHEENLNAVLARNIISLENGDFIHSRYYSTDYNA